MPQRFCCVNKSVDVWRESLRGEPVEIRELGLLLSREENERAERYYEERDRAAFIKGRAVLRKILSSYTGLPPEELQLAAMPNGKPVLANGPAPLYFNLAHSRDIALYAVSAVAEVGIDIEWMNPALEIMEIASEHFSQGEFGRLRAAPSERQPRLFHQIWTAKEAFLKAIGCGLATKLNQVDVQFNAGSSDRVTNVCYCGKPGSDGLPVVELGMDPHYVSMVCLRAVATPV